MSVPPVTNIDLTRISRHMDNDKQVEVLQDLFNRITHNESRHDLFSLYQCELGELRLLHPLIEEICINLLIKNYYAAATLTNMLFEATFKLALIYLKSGGRTLDDVETFEDIHKQEVASYDDQNLEQNINACKQAGFITKDESKQLKFLSQRFRNPLSHASFSKIASGVKGTFVIADFNNPTDVKVQEMNISNIPIFYTRYLDQFVHHETQEYFYTIMHFVDKFDAMITEQFQNHNSEQSASMSVQ